MVNSVACDPNSVADKISLTELEMGALGLISASLNRNQPHRTRVSTQPPPRTSPNSTGEDSIQQWPPPQAPPTILRGSRSPQPGTQTPSPRPPPPGTGASRPDPCQPGQAPQSATPRPASLGSSTPPLRTPKPPGTTPQAPSRARMAPARSSSPSRGPGSTPLRERPRIRRLP